MSVSKQQLEMQVHIEMLIFLGRDVGTLVHSSLWNEEVLTFYNKGQQFSFGDLLPLYATISDFAQDCTVAVLGLWCI